MAQKGQISRPVTKEECHWLKQDLAEGKIVFRFGGYTYGCIAPTGVAVSDSPDEHPFYEVPEDAVTWL